jgi:hypothetical protein
MYIENRAITLPALEEKKGDHNIYQNSMNRVLVKLRPQNTKSLL